MTKIEWTDETWNPIRARDRETGAEGWACVHVSPGCLNCYAETINKAGGIYGGTKHTYTVPALREVAHYLDMKALEKPLHWKKPRRIFVCSMTDLFGEWVAVEWLDQIFAIMALTPQHTYQLLTKRPARMREFLSGEPGIPKKMHIEWNMGLFRPEPPPRHWYHVRSNTCPWPLPNVWLGVSAEDQQRWDERVPDLLRTPAAVRWVSYEPALGPIASPIGMWTQQRGGVTTNAVHLDWVVVGGESGSKARPFDIAWARDMLMDGRRSNVPVFVKQMGSNPVTACAVHGVGCGGHKWPWNENAAQARGKEPRPKLKDRKGGDMSEWPEDLRVREWPR